MLYLAIVFFVLKGLFMTIIDILGSMAGAFTTISFVPQLIKVVKTKSTQDISLAMFILFAIGVLCWFAYGILTTCYPVIIANGIVFVMTLVIIGYKIRYK